MGGVAHGKVSLSSFHKDVSAAVVNKIMWLSFRSRKIKLVMCLLPRSVYYYRTTRPVQIRIFRKRFHARAGALNLDHLNLGWPQYLSQISFDILPKKKSVLIWKYMSSTWWQDMENCLSKKKDMENCLFINTTFK